MAETNLNYSYFHFDPIFLSGICAFILLNGVSNPTLDEALAIAGSILIGLSAAYEIRAMLERRRRRNSNSNPSQSPA